MLQGEPPESPGIQEAVKIGGCQTFNDIQGAKLLCFVWLYLELFK